MIGCSSCMPNKIDIVISIKLTKGFLNFLPFIQNLKWQLTNLADCEKRGFIKAGEKPRKLYLLKPLLAVLLSYHIINDLDARSFCRSRYRFNLLFVINCYFPTLKSYNTLNLLMIILPSRDRVQAIAFGQHYRFTHYRWGRYQHTGCCSLCIPHGRTQWKRNCYWYA